MSSSASGFQFGLDSHRPSTASLPSNSAVSTPHLAPANRWDLPIVREPQYPIIFWNMNREAEAELERTNNSLEASHRQFQVL